MSLWWSSCRISPWPPLIRRAASCARQTIWLSVQFCLLWFLANVSSNASLQFTTVTSSTILSSTSGALVWYWHPLIDTLTTALLTSRSVPSAQASSRCC